MRATIIMSDADYQRIIAANGKRIRGSIGMITPTTFDFHAFAPTPEPPDGTPSQVLRTAYGKTTIRPDKVRFVVLVKRKNPQPDINAIIYDEADAATEFVAANIN